MSGISIPADRNGFENISMDPGLVTTLRFTNGDNTGEEPPDWKNCLQQALPSFGSLESILFTGFQSWQRFIEVLNTIAACDNIVLIELEAELEWKFFAEVPESWEKIFKDLKTLHIDFGDNYDAHTPECVSGLTTVLKWASKLTELHCNMHWSLYWDDIASEWPNLESLKLDACQVTESFLRRFFEEHPSIKLFHMLGCLVGDKEGSVIGITAAAKIFCSAEFNGVLGDIRQDEYSNWYNYDLRLLPKYIAIVWKGVKVIRIFQRE